jgi:hypothetical protein
LQWLHSKEFWVLVLLPDILELFGTVVCLMYNALVFSAANRKGMQKIRSFSKNQRKTQTLMCWTNWNIHAGAFLSNSQYCTPARTRSPWHGASTRRRRPARTPGTRRA